METRQPIQERGIETRNRILAAGWDLFSEKGLHGTSSREISSHAGVSIGSFYCYFKDKRELFLELLRKHRLDMAQLLNGLSPPGTGENAWQRLMHQLIAALWEQHELIRDFDKKADILRNLDPEIDAVLKQQEEAILQQVVFLLESVRDQLRKPDVELAAMTALITIREFMHGAPRFASREDRDRVVRELADMVSRYLFKTG